jgi:polysaccharide pyruvyl transferase CsaB
MKVLITAMSLDIGGAETHIVELASELTRRGDEVVIASAGGVYVKDIEERGIRHFAVPMDRRSIGCMLRSLRLLRQIIRKEKPDVVHAHARIPAFLCGLLRPFMRFPLVTTAHAVFQTGLGFRLLSNWGQKTIAVSEDIRRYLMENYNVKDRNITATINGIDTSKFAPAENGGVMRKTLGLPPDGFVIGHISRLDDNTTLVAETLIDLAPQLDEALGGACVLITGGGQHFDALYKKAKAINDAAGRDLVVMTGARTDISDVLQAVDLFVGVSRAALEAMAAENPVVLAGFEGRLGLFTPEILKPAQESNFCCRGHDQPTAETLFDDIVKAFKERTDAERKELGRFGRAIVEREYSVARMTDDCRRVYDSVRRYPHNVVLLGYYGFGNAGDEAILQSIYTNITEADGDVGVTALSIDPAATAERYGCRAADRFSPISVFRALLFSDALVLGGGSLLQDLTSTRSLIYYLTIIRFAELFGKKIMVYANGIGPISRPFNRRLVRRILGRADIITLRDAASAEELRKMGVERDDLRVTADPVFTLRRHDMKAARRLLDTCGIAEGREFICVSVRNWHRAENLEENIARLCDGIYSKCGVDILFLPMHKPQDLNFSRRVTEKMQSPAFLLDTPCSAEEMLGVIAQSRFSVAMRLHALVFSACVHVPFAGIVYDPKVEAYLKAFEMPAAGLAENLDPDAALQTAVYVSENREELSRKVAESAAAFEERAREDTRLLITLLKSPKVRRKKK